MRAYINGVITWAEWKRERGILGNQEGRVWFWDQAHLFALSVLISLWCWGWNWEPHVCAWASTLLSYNSIPSASFKIFNYIWSVHVYKRMQMPKETRGIWSPWCWNHSWLWMAKYGYWEPNSGSLEGKHPLNHLSSPEAHIFFYKNPVFKKNNFKSMRSALIF